MARWDVAERADGYYWIIDGKNVPEVAAWSHGQWWLTGCDEPASEEQVVVLGDRLTLPTDDGAHVTS